jgi:molecular chaperone GrpE
MSTKEAKQETPQSADTADSSNAQASAATSEAEMMQEEASLYAAEEAIAEQLKQAEQKAAEHWELLLRTKAEMENLRRRTQKDLENAHKFALEKFVMELLPVKDSMELGLSVETADTVALRAGMQLTLSLLKNAFDKFRIAEVNPINEKFNPDLHQAMAMQASAEVEPNTVLAVMQKGYTLNDRIVRPAMVMVSKSAE